MMRLSGAENYDGFAKVIAAGFLLRGVQGMPPIRGEDPLEFASKYDLTPPKFNALVNHLPPRYFISFGESAWKLVYSKVGSGDRDTSEMDTLEVLQDYSVKWLSGAASKINEGSSVRDAMNYVKKGLKHQSMDFLRKRGRRRQREVSDVMYTDDEGQEKRHEIETAPDVEELMEQSHSQFTTNEVQRILKKTEPDLERIHPLAPTYVTLYLEKGMSDVAFIREEQPLNRQGRPMSPASWNATYKKKILEVLRDEVLQHPDLR